jgi:hypothetical protein
MAPEKSFGQDEKWVVLMDLASSKASQLPCPSGHGFVDERIQDLAGRRFLSEVVVQTELSGLYSRAPYAK